MLNVSCICDRMLLEEGMLQFVPSLIAAAAVYIVRYMALHDLPPLVAGGSGNSGSGGGGGNNSKSTNGSNDNFEMLQLPTDPVELAAYRWQEQRRVVWTPTLAEASQYAETEVIPCVRAIVRILADETADRARIYANNYLGDSAKTLDNLLRSIQEQQQEQQQQHRQQQLYNNNKSLYVKPLPAGAISKTEQSYINNLPHILLRAEERMVKQIPIGYISGGGGSSDSSGSSGGRTSLAGVSSVPESAASAAAATANESETFLYDCSTTTVETSSDTSSV